MRSIVVVVTRQIGDVLLTTPLIREARRQSRLIAEQPEEAEVMDWLDSVRDTTGWDPQ